MRLTFLQLRQDLTHGAGNLALKSGASGLKSGF